MLDEIHIEPLIASQIKTLIDKYLAGDDAGALFWQLVGGDYSAQTQELFRQYQSRGMGLDDFLDPAHWPDTYYYWERQQIEVILADPRRLYHLAQNPFMLIMLIGIYQPGEGLPSNRVNLFEQFIDLLLRNEACKKHQPSKLADTIHRQLNAQLQSLAWAMQNRAVSEQAVNSDSGTSTVELSLSLTDVKQHLSAEQMKLALDAGNEWE